MRELIRKFKYAEYALNNKDYEEARKALSSLSNGKDDKGPLYKIPSALVLNNIGCAWFHIQRSKQFKASNMLFAARKLLKSESRQAEIIESNIIKLDKMTNKID